MDVDFTNQYNTPLTPEEQTQFDAWAQNQTRDVQNDKYDYDIQGWQKANPGVNLSDAHLTDQFKKPNHPTFSDQSQYHGKDGLQGGSWTQLPDGSYTFTPGTTNLKMFTPSEMQDYFKKVEPKNKLILPKFKLSPISYNPFTEKLPSAHEQMLQQRDNSVIRTMDPGTHWGGDKNVIMPEDIAPSNQENI